MKRGQRGQVMVIVALLMVAMVGMIGLGIDGGRLYVERRVQQTGVDAAALAAADKYWAVVQTAPSSNQTGVQDAFAAAVDEYSYQANLSPSGWSPNPLAYSAPADACKSGAATATQAFTQSGHTLTMSAIPVSQATLVTGLCVFNASETSSVGTFFIQVLNGVTTNVVAVTASALSGHVLTSPTLVVLNSDCNSDWKANGNSVTTIVGSAWDNGDIFDTQSGTNVIVSGHVYDHCDASVPSPQFQAAGGTTGHAPILPDPLKNWPNTTFQTACKSGSLNGTGSAGTWTVGTPGTCNLATSATDAGTIGAGAQNKVVLKPGKYTAADGLTGGGCWFMAPGIYEWANGATQGAFQMSTHGQVMSNELVPPGVADLSTNLYPSLDGGITPGKEAPQFSWTDSAQTCNGGWQLNTPAACVPLNCGIAAGTYWFRITSAREDNSMWRESYMSNTRTSAQVTPATTTDGCIGPIIGTGLTKLQFGISNVPGMGNPGDTTQYNIYASNAGGATCPADSTFGFVASAKFTSGPAQTEEQLGPASHHNGCPWVPTPSGAFPATANLGQQDATNCTLGFVWSTVLDGTNLGTSWAASGFCDVLTGAWTTGCKPDYENPASAGDIANEDYCRTTSGTASLCVVSPFSATGDPTTPGGAMFYFPSSTSCIFQTNGAPYIYGSLGYRSVVLYAEAPGVCGTNGASINGGDKSGGTSLFDAQYIGQVYIPTAQLTVSGGGSPIDGALVVWMLNTVGDAATTLTGRFPFVQITTPGHLITCTNGAVGPGYVPAGNTYCPKP